MFSEYASRFLAQSQSRISSLGQSPSRDPTSPDATPAGHNPADWFSARPTRGSTTGRGFSRGLAATPSSNRPYNQPSGGAADGAQSSRFAFGFASRFGLAAQDAPLFRSNGASEYRDDHAATSPDPDPFRHPYPYPYLDSADHHDHDREAADLYALQRSRRVAAASKLAESLGTEGADSVESMRRSASSIVADRLAVAACAGTTATSTVTTTTTPPIRPGVGGFRSVWRPHRPLSRSRDDRLPDDQAHNLAARAMTPDEGVGLVDVGLSSHHFPDDDVDDEPPASLMREESASTDGSSPPPFQRFHARPQSPSTQDRHRLPSQYHAKLPVGTITTVSIPRQQPSRPARRHSFDTVTEAETEAAHAVGPAGRAGFAGPGISATPRVDSGDILFRHDSFFAWLFLVLVAAMLATYALVWLHTTPPSPPSRLGDSVYAALESSLRLLALDTILAVAVAIVWLLALRAFVRPLVVTVVVATPIVLVAAAVYPFAASFGAQGPGGSLAQDRAMRLAALVPLAGAALWVYVVVRARHSLSHAVRVLEFVSAVLADNPALLLLGASCLAVVVAWAWLWLAMFARLFLAGSFNRRAARWVLDPTAWWLAAWFGFMLVWVVAVVAAVQRAAAAATVSQWYFHRNQSLAAFPTIAAAPTVAARSPAVAPPTSRRVVAAAVHFALTTAFGSVCQSALLALLVRAPLLLLPRRLAVPAIGLTGLVVPGPVAALTNPLSLTFAAIHALPLAASARALAHLDPLAPAPATGDLPPYRLAKTILSGTRYVTATVLGFAAWVVAAKQLLVAGTGSARGSGYAYVVALVAFWIGLFVTGCMEATLATVLDAVTVCYATERRMNHRAAGPYCAEAATLFGDPPPSPSPHRDLDLDDNPDGSDASPFV